MTAGRPTRSSAEPLAHRARVESLLRDAALEHEQLLRTLPATLADSLPVDAQGITRAIDHLAAAAGHSPEERRALVRPHAVNPAVLHARVFGREPLSAATTLASFVDGARVRADALGALADRVGGEPLGTAARRLLVSAPLPTGGGPEAIVALRAAYAAQEQAAVRIAAWLDGDR